MFFFWGGEASNADPIFINPSGGGCSPPKVMIPHFAQGHPPSNKQGLMNVESTLVGRQLGLGN